MPTKVTRAAEGALLARRAASNVGRELRDARLAAGLAQRTVGRAAGMSGAQVGRIERSVIAKPTVDQLARVAVVLGMALSVRLFPVGDAIRDAGQLALLARLSARLPDGLRLRREVPLPIRDDRRAWDGRIEGRGPPCAVEAEVHLLDAQALTRRVALKLRDDPAVDRVILLVARSAHNRRVLHEHREAWRADFPLDGASILACLRRGDVPPASGILML